MRCVWSSSRSSRYHQYVGDVDVCPCQMDVAVLRRRTSHRLPAVGGGARRLRGTDGRYPRRWRSKDGVGKRGSGVEHGGTAADVWGCDSPTTRHWLRSERGGTESVRCWCSCCCNCPHFDAQCRWGFSSVYIRASSFVVLLTYKKNNKKISHRPRSILWKLIPFRCFEPAIVKLNWHASQVGRMTGSINSQRL